MWAFIQRATQPQGGAQVAVALTTHSMEECEALCGRVGILAAGYLRCLASPTRLKALYCHQYILEVGGLLWSVLSEGRRGAMCMWMIYGCWHM